MPGSRNTPTGTPTEHNIQVMGVGPDVVADIEDLRNTSDERPVDGAGIYWSELLQLWIYTPVGPGLAAHAALWNGHPPHGLGSAMHLDTPLAGLNALITDANLDDAGDPRYPTPHAPSHVDPLLDPIQYATAAQRGLMSNIAQTFGGVKTFNALINALGGIANSAAELLINFDAAQDAGFFGGAASGETPSLKVSGFFAADALRAVLQGIVAADTYGWTGASNYTFDGKVGVGVAPTEQLTALDTLGVRGATNPIVKVVDTTSNIAIILQSFNADAWVGTQTNHPLRLVANNTEWATLTQTGDVGIGILVPLAKLDVVGTTRFGDSATNYTGTEADGTLKFTGAATVWDDIQFDTDSGKVPAANAPTWEALTPNTSAFAFSVDDYKDLKANEYGHAYKEGETAHMHAHVTIKTAQATGADRFVKLQVWVAYADQSLSVWAEVNLSAEVTVPTGSSALEIFYLDLGDVDLSGYSIGTQIKARIKRIAATGGTEYADDVYITQVGAHLEKDTVGSRTELTK